MAIEKQGEQKSLHQTTPDTIMKRYGRMPPGDEEIIRGYWSEDEYALNGKKIESIGVGHHPYTLEIPEYKRKIESLIERSSVVLLEFAPDIEVSYSIQKLKPIVKSIGYADKECEEYLYRNLQKNPGLDFYRIIQSMIAAKKTRLATSDPDDDFYKGARLKAQEKKVQNDKSLMLTASLFTLAGYLGFEGIMRLVELTKNKQLQEKKMSRRDFLKIIGLVAAGVGSADALSLKASDYRKHDVINNRVKNPLGAFLYDLLDYRDASVADGLDWLSKKNLGEGPIGIIYGDAHVSAIKHYALSPIERKAKLAAYEPYKIASTAQTKIFEFDGKWKLIDKS